MSLYLGIDIGGTATRWSVVDDRGSLVDRGIADGASGLIYDAASLARFVGALEVVRDALPGRIVHAQLGITGAGFSRHVTIEEQVGRILSLPLSAFSYSNDTTLAWQAAFGGRKGHLVSAGTGSVGMTFDSHGDPLVVGGRGILVDDGGSGVWIALRALDRLYRRIEEEGRPKGAEILASTLFAAMGGGDRDALRGFVYGRDRGRIGTLAVAVAEAAREGCPMAQGLLQQAGQELARLGRVMLSRCGPAPVAFVGGVLALDPSIRQTIEVELHGHDLEFPRIDAALQAAQMAREKGKMTA
jgi:N-acetylglucosamine kinase-like BadF-type ATPase